MKRISFNPQFINKAGNDLIPGKIHTIRQNYEYWKKFEGKNVALFTIDKFKAVVKEYQDTLEKELEELGYSDKEK